MAVLVVAEHDNASLKDATNKVVTAAKAMSNDVDVLVAGVNAGAAAQAAAKVEGVRKVLHADGATLDRQLAEALDALVTPLMANYDAVLFPATTTGKNAAPRIAARLDVAQLSGVIGVESADTFVRPIYAGNAIVTVKSAQAKNVLTVQPTTFKAAGNGGSASVETIAAPAGPFKTAFVSEEMAKSDRPELTGAKRVVSGGRALGSNEEFHKVLEPLADKLGAAVGASRAAVDAGYAPNDYQVGQTGKVVAPELYVAIGISGAIQHLAGMKDSKVIVAINKDEEAPIFQVADYGLVADYKTAVPELMDELTKAGVN
ncbi:MAG: electron transfer flavoprotein subunit alpha/FixB family protein [Hyphomonadaceae bacterium]